MVSGRKVANPSFVIFSVKNNLPNCHFGISTPQKLIKKAVDRNRYKRQVRDMIISHLKKHADSCQINDNHIHCNFVIIIRYPYLENDFATNQKNLYKLLLADSNKGSNSRFENDSSPEKK
ncbi:MAG: ribonuclease P protein component [Mollicutes bacterium UO1]